MDQQTVRKTYKYRLKPTPQQEQALAFVVRRCRALYHAGLQERHEAWHKCGVSVTAASQSAQWPDIKEARPEYREAHSQGLQDVLTRLDRAFQRFFARLKNGEAAGYPASTAPLATTASPLNSSATGPRWRTASSSSPRSAGLRYAGPAR
jgi:transposase